MQTVYYRYYCCTCNWNRNYDRMPQDVQGQKISDKRRSCDRNGSCSCCLREYDLFWTNVYVDWTGNGNGTLSDETNEEAAEVAEEIMEDGIVLLKNESLLPLNETKKLNIFGWESINPAYGGAGSGGINDLYDIVSLNQGLENAGFSINQELVDFYNNYGADNPEMSIQKQSWTLPEPPVDTYSDELIKSAKEYSDVAVVVLSRKAGEGHNDIPMDVRKAAYDNNSDEYDDFPEGEHYLQLSQTERDMVDMVCSNFDNVIVVYNGANQFELGFADEYPQIKSVVWCPGTGNVGFNALGKVFSGEVNPSGKTPDTFIYDMTTAP